MDFEFKHVFAANEQDLWAVLLDPDKVAACVPGMQSVTVVSDTEDLARIRVKIAFISAHFDIRTVITEMRPTSFLRAEASGEDGKIGSSVKAGVEMQLVPQGDGRTELQVSAKADVLGRLGTLGLNPMRTKAEGMWLQFCDALAASLAGEGGDTVPAANAAAVPTKPRPAQNVQTQPIASSGSWASRLFGGRRAGSAEFRVELERNGSRVTITCPADRADQCLAWLDRQLGQ